MFGGNNKKKKGKGKVSQNSQEELMFDFPEMEYFKKVSLFYLDNEILYNRLAIEKITCNDRMQDFNS